MRPAICISSFLFICGLFGLMLHNTSTASAFPEGVFGHHGAEAQTCARCHFGGALPDITLIGQRNVTAGSLVTYTLVITSGATNTQQFAGFNLVAEAPDFSYAPGLTPIDASVRTAFNELTHTEPKQNDVGGVAQFQFSWRVPPTTGEYVMYFAGNSVNGDLTTAGDRANDDIAIIQVEPASSPTYVALRPQQLQTTSSSYATAVLSGFMLITVCSAMVWRANHTKQTA